MDAVVAFSILLSLEQLAATLGNGHPLTAKATAGYLASLSPLTKEQQSQLFPRLGRSPIPAAPALLRDFALIGEPVAVAANESSDGSRALRCGFWAGVATQRTTTRRFLRR
jgi:hypothetical protein